MPYIPDSIFKSGIWETLSGVETRVYVILCQHYNRAEKKAYPSVIRIAKMCGSSKSRVIKTVHSLCEKGLVIKRRRLIHTVKISIIIYFRIFCFTSMNYFPRILKRILILLWK